MPRIEFTFRKQIWQTQKLTWREADWEAFKLKIKKQAEEAQHKKEYFTRIYEFIKDMSFDAAIKEYNRWCNFEGDYLMVIGAPEYLTFGTFMNDALCDAAAETPVCDETVYDGEEYAEIYED